MPEANVKPGWKSTEFWLHLAAYVPGILGAVLGQEHPIVLVIGIVSSYFAHDSAKVYTDKRSILKAAAASAAAFAPGAFALPVNPGPFVPPAAGEMMKSTLKSARAELEAALADPETMAAVGSLFSQLKTAMKAHGLEDEDPAPAAVAAAVEPAPARAEELAAMAAVPPAEIPSAAAKATAAGARGAVKTYGGGSTTV